MTLITTFKEKKREKQIKYERTLLRDLSIQMLKTSVQRYFGSSRIASSVLLKSGMEEACYDVAIEGYLLGARMSRFGYFGENMKQVQMRCENELKHLSDTLYNFILYWGQGLGDDGIQSESLFYICEQYVDSWWREGFQKGERRYKLRLH
ncbi:YbaK family protein [Neobacillus sp. LXY-4]|uniref:YbaK family protein n=1 Tax=Neobacillus sp. LXY-4 TaxID=3379826 RepID=UPI003EDE9C71